MSPISDNTNMPDNAGVPNQCVAENPTLYLVLRQDIISNARFLYGSDVEYDLLTSYSNNTAKGLFNVYDAKREADVFELSLVAYTLVSVEKQERSSKGKEKQGRVVIESSGNNQLEAMHILATAIQEMVHEAKRASKITVGDTFIGMNCTD